MNFMIAKAKEKHVYVHNPNDQQVNEMFKRVSGSVFSLKKNQRCETFSWHSFTLAVSKERQRLKVLQ